MTVTLWVALALLAIPTVLLLATAGCGSFGEGDEPVVEQYKEPQPPPGGGQQEPAPSPTPQQPPPQAAPPVTYADTVKKTPGLIAYWRLGEQQSVLATPNPRAVNSFTPGTHDGTYMNPSGIALEQTGALAPKDADTAARFTGGSGSVEVPYNKTLNPDEVTVEALIKVDTAAPEWRVILGCYETGFFNENQVVRGFRLRVRTLPAQGVPVSIEVEGACGGMASPLQSEVAFGSAWHHVVLTYRKAPLGQEQADLYVDDKEASTFKKCDLAVISPTPLRLAYGSSASAGFRGALDEVALYGVYMPKVTVDAHRKALTS